MKTKIFSNQALDSLQVELDNFLIDKNKIDIISTNFEFSNSWYFVLIIYREPIIHITGKEIL